MDLGRRGLLPQSQEGQQALGQALQPITAQFQGLTAQTGIEEQGQINNINQAIAALQGGNPSGAVQAATQIYGAQGQFAAAALQRAIEQQQVGIQQQQANTQALQANYVPIQGYGVFDIAKQQLLGGVNTSQYSTQNPVTKNRILSF